MYQVNIYIQTTAQGPAIRKKAYYMYILGCETKNGIQTRKGSGCIEKCTENQAELTALIKALKRIVKPCSIRVFTRCEHILNSVNNHWVIQWEKNSWRNAGNKPVRNAELWQQYVNLTKEHAVMCINEKHSFSTWMDSELKRIKESDDGKK